MGSLVIVERELTARLPIFAQILPPQLPAERLMRTVLVACERTPKLLDCTQQSIVSSAMTAAVLGLEVDGVTGQGFLIPYAGVAQFQIGYKGYPTIAARSGLSINAAAVREGDDFDFQLGTGGYVHHKPMLAPKPGRKILATWAIATATDRPPLIVVMPYDEVLAIMKKSPGAKKSDSPWNDLNGPGHEAMVVKTGIRRLGRTVPVVAMQLASALDGAQESGQIAYLDADKNLRTVGEGSTAGAYPGRQIDAADDAPPSAVAFEWLMGTGEVKTFDSAAAWAANVSRGLSRDSVTDDGLRVGLENNHARIAAIKRAGHADEAMIVERVFIARGITINERAPTSDDDMFPGDKPSKAA